MSEPFDPSMIPAGDDAATGLLDEPGAGTRLDQAIAQTRSRWDGLEDLPVDEPALETGDAPAVAEPPPAATEPPAPAPVLAADAPLAPAPDPQIAALQHQLTQLSLQLQAMQTAPANDAPPKPAALSYGDTLVDAVAGRFEHTFDTIEGMEAASPDYAKARAREFARTIVDAVYQDILTQDGVQDHIRSVAQPVARQVVSEFDTQQKRQLEGQTVVELAVSRARAAGYDVHAPGTPEHYQSADSLQFWGIGQQISREGRTADEEITDTLRFMPQRQAAPTPTPAPTPQARPQPMGRQGTALPTTTGAAANDGDYQPQNINSILAQQRRIQRIGAA